MKNRMRAFLLAVAAAGMGVAGAQDSVAPPEGEDSWVSTEASEYREPLNRDAVNDLLRLNLTLVEGYDPDVYDRVMSADFFERMVVADGDAYVAMLVDLSRLYPHLAGEILATALSQPSTALNEYDPSRLFTAFLEAVPEPRDADAVIALVDGAMRGADAMNNMEQVRWFGYGVNPDTGTVDSGVIGLSDLARDVLQTAVASEPDLALAILQGVGNDAWPMYLALLVQDGMTTTDFSANDLLQQALAEHPEQAGEILTAAFSLGETDSFGERWEPTLGDARMLELVAELVTANEDNPALVSAVVAAAVTAYPSFADDVVATAVAAAPAATVAVLAGAESAAETTPVPPPPPGTDTGTETDVGTGGGSQPEPLPPEPDPDPVSPA